MRVMINLGKQHLTFFMMLIVVLSSFLLGVNYGSSQPDVMGHSASHIGPGTFAVGAYNFPGGSSVSILDDGVASGSRFLVIGDDSYITDTDSENTMGIYGAQDSTTGSIRLGSGGETITGKDGKIGIGTNTPSSGKLEVVSPTGFAVYGSSDSGFAVYGISSAGTAVRGYCSGSGSGVTGHSASGYAGEFSGTALKFPVRDTNPYTCGASTLGSVYFDYDIPGAANYVLACACYRLAGSYVWRRMDATAWGCD